MSAQVDTTGFAQWQLRVVDEMRQLQTRLDALLNFIGGTQFRTLPGKSRELMREQASFMHHYLEVLVQRVADFQNSDEDEMVVFWEQKPSDSDSDPLAQRAYRVAVASVDVGGITIHPVDVKQEFITCTRAQARDLYGARFL